MDWLFVIYVVFIIFRHHLMLLLLCRLVNRRTRRKKKNHERILLNNEQGNKVKQSKKLFMHKCWFLWGGSAGTFSLPPNSIHSCAAVKLGSEETEEKSIHVSVWPLIFSLLPSFSPLLHHPIFPSLLFWLSKLVRGGQSILTPSIGLVRTSNIPWIHTLPPSQATCTQATPPLSFLSSVLTSVLHSSPFLSSPSPPTPLWDVCRVFLCVAFCIVYSSAPIFAL